MTSVYYLLKINVPDKFVLAHFEMYCHLELQYKRTHLQACWRAAWKDLESMSQGTAAQFNPPLSHSSFSKNELLRGVAVCKFEVQPFVSPAFSI